MFWGMLGCAAGNLALMSCARGGVLIGGGIVPKLLDQFRPAHFRRRFEERGVLQEFVRNIPTAVIVDPDVGLKGAARAFLGAVRFID
jgi:glucokinase